MGNIVPACVSCNSCKGTGEKPIILSLFTRHRGFPFPEFASRRDTVPIDWRAVGVRLRETVSELHAEMLLTGRLFTKRAPRKTIPSTQRTAFYVGLTWPAQVSAAGTLRLRRLEIRFEGPNIAGRALGSGDAALVSR